MTRKKTETKRGIVKRVSNAVLRSAATETSDDTNAIRFVTKLCCVSWDRVEQTTSSWRMYGHLTDHWVMCSYRPHHAVTSKQCRRTQQAMLPNLASHVPEISDSCPENLQARSVTQLRSSTRYFLFMNKTSISKYQQVLFLQSTNKLPCSNTPSTAQPSGSLTWKYGNNIFIYIYIYIHIYITQH